VTRSKKALLTFAFAAAIAVGSMAPAMADGHPDNATVIPLDGHPDIATASAQGSHASDVPLR
jgi:arginase family enzyme